MRVERVAGAAVLSPAPSPRVRLGRWLAWAGSRGEPAQGRHVDPEDPSAPAPIGVSPTLAELAVSQTLAELAESPTLARLADALRPVGGGSVRDGVVGDLAAYYQLSAPEVVRRCLDWERDSVAEWEAGDRHSPAGMADFYNTTTSWSFDLLWWAYVQATGRASSLAVTAADLVGPAAPGRTRWLDVGSGVGVAAQLSASLGYRVTLADVSGTLLEFARWRLQSRGCEATYVHLPADLGESTQDVVTAMDVFAHVADPHDLARQLHRALSPGGLLIANFDVRWVRSRENAWHLHADDLPLRWALARAGFRRVGITPDHLWIYQKRPESGGSGAARRAAAWALLASPAARFASLARVHVVFPAVTAVLRRRARSRRAGD